MGTAYSDQSGSASAYNSSPPADDGSQTASNKVTWANSKTKLGDPVKAYADAINTALQTTLNFGSTQQTTNYNTQASDNMQTIEIPSGSPTISLGTAATMTKNYVVTVTNIGTGAPVIALQTNTDTLDGTVNGTFTFPTGTKTSFTFKVNNAANGYNTEKIGGKTVLIQTSAISPILDSGTGSLVLKGAGTTAATITGANAVFAGTVQGATTIGVGATTPSASGAGVSFPSTQSASSDVNTLDDYEEGTWVPSLGGNTTYTAQVGTYTKIGRLVFIRGAIVVNSIGTGSTTLISGLPFATIETTTFTVQVTSSATSVVSVIGSQTVAGSSIVLFSRTAASASDSGANAIFQNGTTVIVSGCYHTT